MSEQEYALVVREGISTVHKLPAFEECNLDDTDADIKVDVSTGAHLVDKGEARFCEHCFPQEAT
jgi:hypothetical protein